MSTQYRKYECHYCHALKPANQMHKTTIKQKTGGTSMGISFNPAKKNSGRIYAGRSYYTVREIWVCDSCKRTRSSLPFMAASVGSWLARTFLKVVIGIVALLFLVVMCSRMKDKPKPKESPTETVQPQAPVSAQQNTPPSETQKTSSLDKVIDKLKEDAAKHKSAHLNNDEPEYMK